MPRCSCRTRAPSSGPCGWVSSTFGGRPLAGRVLTRPCRAPRQPLPRSSLASRPALPHMAFGLTTITTPSGSRARTFGADSSSPVAVLWQSRAPWVLLNLALLALDLLALAFAFGLAYLGRFKLGLPLLETPSYSGTFYSWIAFWAIPVWVILFGLYGLYDARRVFAGFEEYIRVVNASTTGLVAVVFISFFDPNLLISRGWLVLTWALAILLVSSVRFGARHVLRIVHRHGHLVIPTVIIGANEEGVALGEQLLADSGASARLIGFLDPATPAGSDVVGGLQVLGDFWRIDELVKHQGVRQIVVASSALSRDQLLDLFWNYGQDPDVELRLSSGLYEILTTGVSVREMSSIPLLTPGRVRITGVDAMLKTAIDYLLAATGLVLLSPVMLLIALMV